VFLSFACPFVQAPLVKRAAENNQQKETGKNPCGVLQSFSAMKP